MEIKTGAVLQLYQPEETLNNISKFYSTIFVYHLSALKVLWKFANFWYLQK